MKSHATSASASFSSSLSLFDFRGRLIDWDAGFAREFIEAQGRLAPGVMGRKICDTCRLPQRALDVCWPVGEPAPQPFTYANKGESIEVSRQLSGMGRILRTARVLATEPESDSVDEIPLLRSSLLQMSHSVLVRRTKEEDALRVARAEAELANMAKSQFLATMSHEIRTPLNGVLGMAQMLLTPHLSEENRLHYSRIILHSGQTLLVLLNDILDLSKVEAGKLDLSLSVVDLQEMFEELIELFGAAGLAKGVHLSYERHLPDGYRISGDSVRLRQMATNLLSNAMKFTEVGSVRATCVEIGRRSNTLSLEFSVTDTGIGIPLEKQSQLFEPFVQADASTTRTYGGTGLGLSIVRKLAQLMGGEVGLDSEVGRGSRFWFRINAELVPPDSPEMHSRRQPRAIEPQMPFSMAEDPVSASRVLVVEDNEVNRLIVESLLSSIGVDAELVENGQLGLNAIVGGMRPDAILMDVQMPVMDGIDATRRIRAWERDNKRSRLPIIALSAGVFAEDLRMCVDAGMDDFLEKPIDLSRLRVVLARWLRRPAIQSV
jgi:signal transduction histidine kinase